MKRNPGFTLIELLVSMGILLILATLILQTVGMISATWQAGKARIDAFTQARTTLAALTRDIQNIVLRPDLGAFTDENGSKSALAFYTLMPGSEGDRGVSLVDYQVKDPTSAPRLVRDDYGLDLGSGTSSSRVLSIGETTSLPDLDPSKIKEHELAPNVVRLDWQFLDSDGGESDKFKFDYDNPNATTNTRVIRVSMLVLDGSSYDLLLKTNKLSELLSATNGSPSSGKSLGAYWEDQISSSALSNLPKPVLKSLRVFERSITIPVSR